MKLKIIKLKVFNVFINPDNSLDITIVKSDGFKSILLNFL